MGIASPVVNEEQDEEFIADPEYNKKETIRTANVDYFCRHEQVLNSSSSDNYPVETFNSIDDFVNATILGIKSKYASDVYRLEQTYRQQGWTIANVRLSCEGGGLKLIFDLEESEDKYKQRIKAYEESKKKKAAKPSKSGTNIELPKPISRSKLDKLPWSKVEPYTDFKNNLSIVKRFAKKYGISLPKEIEEWKG